VNLVPCDNFTNRQFTNQSDQRLPQKLVQQPTFFIGILTNQTNLTSVINLFKNFIYCLLFRIFNTYEESISHSSFLFTL